MAEGFLHDFEGWTIFMACVAVLSAEMWLLARMSGDKRQFSQIIGFDVGQIKNGGKQTSTRTLPRPTISALIVLMLSLIVSSFIEARTEITPQRQAFAALPLSLGEWRGSEDRLDKIYIDALKLTDYALVNYHRDTGGWVNFYSAYYTSQRSGASAHSPQSCLPGDGWKISSLERHEVTGATFGGQPLEVNRVQIEKGRTKQLVYYWFQQRGRIITNEYLVKWYLFWDALTRNRTDGALVRLTTVVQPGERWASADTRLTDFARALSGNLEAYIPH